MQPLGQRAAQAAWWSGTELLIRYGAQFITTVVLARLLTPLDFGLIWILMVFIVMGTILTDAGFGAAIIQQPEVRAEDNSTAFYSNIGCAAIAFALLSFFADTIASMYGEPALAPLAKLMAWAFPLAAAGSVPDALLVRQLDFKARAMAQTVASVASGLVGITLALEGFGAWSLAVQALTNVGLRSLMMWLAAGWFPNTSFHLASARKLSSFGGYLLASAFLNLASTRIQILALGRLFPADVVGHYSLAQSGAEAPKGLMSGILGRVGLPVFSKIASDKPALRNALRRALNLSMFIFFPAMLGMALISKPLIVLLYGDKWSAAAPALALLSMAGALWPIHVLNLSALNAQGRSRKFFVLETIKNATAVLTVIIVAPRGPTAVAGAMLAVGLLNTALNTWYSRKMLAYGLFSQLRDQWPTYFITIASLTPAAVIIFSSPPSVARTAVAIGTATSIYFSIAALIRYEAWLDLVQVTRQLRVQSSKTKQ